MSRHDQRFETFNQWVNCASDWLTDHPRYNEGADYPEPHPFRALCFDAKGRLCRNGVDFARARDEDVFPVRWLWPDQVGATIIALERAADLLASGGAEDEEERVPADVDPCITCAYVDPKDVDHCTLLTGPCEPAVRWAMHQAERNKRGG